ncbi:hypothetical protein PVAND_004314 [Polypedilum vanderplanki]|uniref:NF-X1-type domain-containing protein n=1 Tax=Polypedilum vanderplanki TaxID=319348 RepID=A0A9J6BXR6_POLVA|nr:hypothetical protein PVAND_004314 [Polypedilum vanderplanki]
MPPIKEKTSKNTNKKNNNAKFEEIQKKNQEILKERFGKRISESSDDEDGNKVEKSKIESLFKNYQGNESDVARIQQYFDGENLDCLICIRSVKANDKIWNCGTCYLSFHLLCIQRWANDSMNLKRLWHDNQPVGYYDNQGTYIKKKELKLFWDCPNCRTEYKEDEIPRHYFCYCQKEIDPPNQEWLIPHSCGMVCQKPLPDLCSHKCTILCHPGKCPSCPQTIQVSCKCKKSPLKTIRCSQQFWTCSEKCDKKLSCGIHKCEGICHEECPPCKEKSIKRCFCGQKTKEIKCEQEAWSCDKICKKPLSCGNHFCEKKCHGNECGQCPFGFERSCFCGKQIFEVLNCNEQQLDSCGDTCLKQLPCGHQCFSRCHKGECDPCMEHIEKKCRCGSMSKVFTCSKELLCETKCNRQKACKKHSCKARCCVDCLPCNLVCGKMLTCGKHKCEALCHSGNCYPCNEKQKISCRCGSTSIFIRCGKASKHKTPKCKELCKISSKCHHEPLPHHCHIGNCPGCKQICNEPLSCEHKCLYECHDYVKIIVKDKNFVPAGPWDVQEQRIEYKKLPHAPCKTQVEVTCLGGHETVMLNCSNARVSSCGRICGRMLSCGNHKCQKACHEVSDLNNELRDENCEDCELPCMKERPKGCTHQCSRSCHDSTKPCKKCVVQIKSKCFCGLTEVYYRCCDVYKRDIDDATRQNLLEKYRCCGARCIKLYPCGHQCTMNCHYGECQGAENCKKKVKLLCSCKNRRVEFSCDKIRAENITFANCNEDCDEKKRLLDEEKQKKLEKQRAIEEEKNRRELEEYEKKIGPKKYKERKQRVVEEKKSNFKMIIGISTAIILIIAILLYFMLYKI